MKKCQNCNHMNDDNARYCKNCYHDFGLDKSVDGDFDSLNSNSSSDQIYFALKSVLRGRMEKVVKTDQSLRNRAKQAFLKKPEYFKPDERDYWGLLNRAEEDLLDMKRANELFINFLLTLLLATDKNLNPVELKKATDKLFDEFGKSLMQMLPTTETKLLSTLSQLRGSFVLIVTK